MTGAATIVLAVVFYGSLAALIELIETARERRAAAGPPERRRGIATGRSDRETAGVRRRMPLDIAWTTLLVVAATACSFALAPATLAPEDIVMLYLAAVMFAALRFGQGAAVLAAALSVAAYDFLFIPPLYTFFVASSRHLVTFSMMFAVGITLSTLAKRLKRRGIEAALKSRNEEMKTALLSAVSHDLRTPLGAITGAATALRDDDGRIPADERRALLEAIADEGFHLERLVANLLDMTRIESGTLRLKLEWIPLEELVGSALARTEARLGPRAVSTSIDAAATLVHVDPGLFELVLVNLLENAAKHTPPAARIEVTAAPCDGGVEVVVADDGPGIPDGVDVFERFVRGPHAQGGGVGLGLAIAKGIVEAHGGSIAVDARERGAAFRIALPVGEAPGVPEAP